MPDQRWSLPDVPLQNPTLNGCSYHKYIVDLALGSTVVLSYSWIDHPSSTCYLPSLQEVDYYSSHQQVPRPEPSPQPSWNWLLKRPMRKETSDYLSSFVGFWTGEGGEWRSQCNKDATKSSSISFPFLFIFFSGLRARSTLNGAIVKVWDRCFEQLGWPDSELPWFKKGAPVAGHGYTTEQI